VIPPQLLVYHIAARQGFRMISRALGEVCDAEQGLGTSVVYSEK